MVKARKLRLERFEELSRQTDLVFSRLLKRFRRFGTEKQVRAFILREIKSQTARPSFLPIVASGPNGAIPHHRPKGKLLPGFCVIDFGLRKGEIATDMTRTVYVGKKPSSKERKLYGLVRKAQARALAGIKPGMKGAEARRIAEKELGGYSKNFIHGLGHGLGRRIHMKPSLKKGSRDRVKEGHFITIEPGLYFVGRFGIRIEDTAVVGERGIRALTKSTKRLVCL